jgi:hypothetical protein
MTSKDDDNKGADPLNGDWPFSLARCEIPFQLKPQQREVVRPPLDFDVAALVKFDSELLRK